MELLQASALFATPLLIAALGELLVERCGVVNISIEGMMLSGALAAWAGNGLHGPATGVLLALVTALLLGCIFSLAALALAADQIVAGTGVNLLAVGVTALLYKRLEPLMADHPADPLSPWWLVGMVPALGAAVWVMLSRTRWGLEIIATGHSPGSAHAAGIHVNRLRFAAVLTGAACAGLAGAYLSTMRVQRFVENMTDGQGFLALAIVIFGRWSAPGVLGAGLFFGLVRSGAYSLELSAGLGESSRQLLRLAPYVVSLAALAGVAGRTGAPAALGKPYIRG